MIKEHIRTRITARYWNVNYAQVAIVACITQNCDWAAYIGGTRGKQREEETVAWVADQGAKLSEEDARHFFPHIRLPYRQ